MPTWEFDRKKNAMVPAVAIWMVAAAAICSGHHQTNNLNTLFKWSTMKFKFLSEEAETNLIQSGQYIPGTNTLPLDVDVWYKGNERTIFLTFPKFRTGVPATLGTISEIPATHGESPLIQPFPNWSWHTQKTCEGMTSVFRTQVDKCNRLWAIDSGMVDLFLPTRRLECQPKLLVFNLHNKSFAGKHLFLDSVLMPGSLLTNVVVEVRDTQQGCSDTFAYVSDTTAPALLVFDMKHGNSWRITSNSMYPYPPYGRFLTNNVEFNLMDGILGMALTPTDRGDGYLFYHSLASLRESWVPTATLKKKESFASLQSPTYKYFKTSDEARKYQSLTEAFDKKGILYFGMLDNSLNCWNHRTPFDRNNIHQIAVDNTNLQFSSGLKIIPREGDEEEIWVVTNRFQIIMVGDYNPEEINFRVLKGNLNELMRNGKCQRNSFISFPNRTVAHEKRPFEMYQSSNHGYHRKN